MALIKCPECGKEISNNSIVCPNCGYGYRNESLNRATFNFIGWFLLGAELIANLVTYPIFGSIHLFLIVSLLSFLCSLRGKSQNLKIVSIITLVLSILI